MGRLTKFWHLTRREKKAFCEASILLSLSNASVRTISFRHIERFLRTRWNGGTPTSIDQEEEIRLVHHSVSCAANVLPWKSTCLNRSIAEFIMLWRRGIPVVMFAGARFSGISSLEAHAWVDAGPELKNTSSKFPGFATVIRIGTGRVDS
jgi:Transglutaminase-like superfamily